MKTKDFIELTRAALTRKPNRTELTKRYNWILNYIVEGWKFQPFRWTGSRRHLHLSGQTEADDFVYVASLFGVAVTTGNDAPRGGKEGEFFQTDAREFATIRKAIKEAGGIEAMLKADAVKDNARRNGARRRKIAMIAKTIDGLMIARDDAWQRRYDNREINRAEWAKADQDYNRIGDQIEHLKRVSDALNY